MVKARVKTRTVPVELSFERWQAGGRMIVYVYSGLKLLGRWSRTEEQGRGYMDKDCQFAQLARTEYQRWMEEL